MIPSAIAAFLIALLFLVAPRPRLPKPRNLRPRQILRGCLASIFLVLGLLLSLLSLALMQPPMITGI
ncbi:hypothetical protein [Candidatus Oscillochloris fontis]|uniref:hypothetical protein n=1 Tax=Candidatus Oscillochloris fontis TaxID=2496868 RepID=UPI00101C7142|nr:hypothetical protein [Candidatus Oscillochloris fontis]